MQARDGEDASASWGADGLEGVGVCEGGWGKGARNSQGKGAGQEVQNGGSGLQTGEGYVGRQGIALSTNHWDLKALTVAYHDPRIATTEVKPVNASLAPQALRSWPYPQQASLITSEYNNLSIYSERPRPLAALAIYTATQSRR